MDDLDYLKRNAPVTEEPDHNARERARTALTDKVGVEAVAGSSRRRRLPRSVRRWSAVAAAVAVAAVVGAFVVVGGTGDADTASATAALHKAAEVALKQPAPVVLDEGQYLYVKSEGVNLATAAAGDDAFSALVPFTREVWMGAHSLLTQRHGSRQFITAKDRSGWIAQGRPDLGPDMVRVPLDAVEPPDLPTDVSELYDLLEEQAQEHNDSMKAKGAPYGSRVMRCYLFGLVGDNLRESTATPAQRAALYEVAAHIPGVELVGEVTEEGDRAGIAVAMTDPGTRWVLVFDPQTAQLLAEERTALAGNEFGLPAGTVFSRTTYLVSAVVSSNAARPAAAD